MRLISLDAGDSSFESAEDLSKPQPHPTPHTDSFSFQTKPGYQQQPGLTEDPMPPSIPALPPQESQPLSLSDNLDPPVDDKVLRVQQRLLDEEAKPAHARSPALEVLINDVDTIAVIDEGAEISACSLKFTKKCHLRIIPTKRSAKAADSSRLRVVG